MSLAEEMLATMSASDESVSYLADEEPHIIIDGTRKIIVPNALKLIAVQGDKDIETVTFDCVRYWDGNDLSSFAIYINYILPNKAEGTYIPQNVTRFDDIFSFEWKIGKEITHTKGSLTFWIVAKLTNDDADVIKQWSSLQNSECTIAQGGDKTYVPESQTDKDVISQVLSVSQASALRAEEAAISAENRYELVRDLTGSVVELSGNALRDAKRAEAAAEQSAVKADSSLLSAENALQSERAAMEYESRARSSAESAARAATHAEAVVAGVNEKIERNSKRITNLEQGLPYEQFMTDSTVAHVKDVPVNALPFAEVSKVGGMTRKCRNLWNKGDVSGTNLYKISASYPKGTYTFGYVGNCDSSQATKVRFVLTLANGKQIGQYLDKGKYVTATIECDADITEFFFSPTDTRGNLTNADFTVTNIMLNEGSTALPYEPYFEGLRDAKVTEMKSVGVNLWDEQWEVGQLDVNTGGPLSGTTRIRSKNYISLDGETVYYCSYDNNSNVFCCYDENYKFLGTKYQWDKGFTTLPNTRYVKFMFHADYGAEYKNDIIISKTKNLPYSPYTCSSLPIPEAVRNLDGYGEGNPDNAEEYNAIINKDGKWKYSHKGNIENNLWLPLATPEITDISDLLSADNFLAVEGGGTVTAVNENGLKAPSEITYMLKETTV